MVLVLEADGIVVLISSASLLKIRGLCKLPDGRTCWGNWFLLWWAGAYSVKL